MNAIGIDIGTTGICGVAIDTESGKVLRSVTKNSNAFIKGTAEWEKIQSVDTVIGIAKDILDGLTDSNTVSIGITGQMHGIVYINSDGDAVSPLYTWQDKRGDLPYGDTTYAKFLGSFTGYGCVTDLYNRENGIRPVEATTFCTIHDYFSMKLCGLKKPLIHSSNAASFGCYDIIKNKFSYDTGAEVTNDCFVVGKYKNIPVGVTIGDNQASVFSTLTDTNDLLLNVGTGSQISIISDTPISGDGIETRPYFEGKYLIVGSALCGGRAYSILKDFYSKVIGYTAEADDDTVYRVMDNMLKAVKSTSLSVDTRFAGTRNEPDIRGSISGITAENFNPEELTLGVLEGMALELFRMYEKMGVKKSGIIGSGNGVRKNPALVSVFEKLFDAKMLFPSHLEEAAFGASLFGLICSDVFENAESAQKLIKYSEVSI